MSASTILTSLAALAARRPLAVLGVTVVLTLTGAGLALRLAPQAGTDTLVGRTSATYQATQRFHQHFGDEAVIVLVRGSLPNLVLTRDIEKLLGLEGCLSGNVPVRSTPRGPLPVTPHGGPNGPCARLGREHTVQVVYGPGTFINESARQIADQFQAQSTAKATEAQQAQTAAYQLARGQGRSPAQARRLGQQARQLVNAEFTRTVLQLALQYGIRSVPELNNPDFVDQLVFDSTKPTGTPKARFAYLFPTASSALVQVRLRPGLSDARRSQTIAQIRQAVRMPDWHLAHGQTYVVTGVPVIVTDLSRSITDSIVVLLVAALIVMAATLALVFRGRPRLLPLGIALVAAALTFGALALAGATLTMATIAVLPVLIGLAVDYAIQFQSRFEEQAAYAGGDARAVLERSVTLGAPTIATAAAATAGGFLVLGLSPVPMVRGFGLLLVAGIVLSFLCALTAGSAMLTLARGRSLGGQGAARVLGAGARGRAVLGSVAPAWRGAGELLRSIPGGPRARRAHARAGSRLSAIAHSSLELATRRPERVLALALALAAVGWVADTQTRVESDIQKLVPQNLQALRNLSALQRSTGVGGEIDVMISAEDLTRPEVVSWMTSYQGAVLARLGYSAKRGCGRAQLCPAFSLPDLLRTQGANPSQGSVRALLSAVPPYFSQGVITGDHRVATLAFGIRLMPLDQQQRVIDVMRAQLHPPPDVSAQLVGLPVLAAEANQRIASPWRRLETMLAGLLAVGLVLLLALRRPERALLPLIPIALATGWSALVLFLVRIPLNPMSVTLGALVIAISTEFSVLLSERYRQERAAGHDPAAALRRTYRFTGAAVLASGVTAIAGFAVLVISDIRMLRDFGLVTVIDLTVSLLGVMVVLPAVLTLAEQGELLAAPAHAMRTVLERRPRRRRPSAA